MKPQSPAIFVSKLMLLLLIAAIPALCQQETANKVVVERVGDTAFIQLHAPSFQALTLGSRHSPIGWSRPLSPSTRSIYDQFSAYGLRHEGLFEEISPIRRNRPRRAMAKISGFRQTVLGQPRESQRA